MHEVYRQLGPGLPEYVYQEALMSELLAKGIAAYKELEFHPLYKGQPMKTYIKMDMVAECPEGNVIIECKAMWQLTERERYRLSVIAWRIIRLLLFSTSVCQSAAYDCFSHFVSAARFCEAAG